MNTFPNISGIYLIKNNINFKIYIGSAIHYGKRKGTHLASLRRNKHHSLYLQRAFNKYGESNFEFLLIEKVDKQFLLQREQYYIDRLKPEYNMDLTAGSPIGRVVTEETRMKMSLSQTGRKHSNETLLKLSESKKKENLSINTLQKYSDINKGSNNPSSKLTEDIVYNIKLDFMNGIKRKDLPLKYNISRQNIDLILNEEAWVHIKIKGYIKPVKRKSGKPIEKTK